MGAAPVPSARQPPRATVTRGREKYHLRRGAAVLSRSISSVSRRMRRGGV
jgi:hypothetical protein